MNDPKTWLILGADAGLGPGSMKYLLSQRHNVFGINMQELTQSNNKLITSLDFNSLDHIINNSNYHFLSGKNNDIPTTVAETMMLLSIWLPLLSNSSASSIINLPPQLCLATLAEPDAKDKMLYRMDQFLKTLHQELISLPYNLHFIEPGERFMQF